MYYSISPGSGVWAAEFSGGVAIGEGEIAEGGKQIVTTVEALEKVIGQLDNTIETAEKEVVPEQAATAEETKIDGRAWRGY